ncbi:MAG: hypothetical protein ACRDGA_00345 [Bacteroidota bacterium]
MKPFVTLFMGGILSLSSSSVAVAQSEDQVKELQSEVKSICVELILLKERINAIERLLIQRGATDQPPKPTATPEKKPVYTPDAKPAENLDTQKPAGQQAAMKCQAITKQGTQCSRNAKPGSMYCGTHGG